MLFKSFALCAALAAVAPAFAAPVAEFSQPNLARRQLIDVNTVVSDILNNLTIKVLSSRSETPCTVNELTAIVTADLKGQVASTSKRGGCDVPAVKNAVREVLNFHADGSSPSKRGNECYSLATITAVVENVANNANIDILSTRGSGCDSSIDLNVLVQDVLENLDVKILSSKRGESYTTLANVAIAIYNVLNNLVVKVASSGKRGNDDTLIAVLVELKNILNNANIDVLST